MQRTVTELDWDAAYAEALSVGHLYEAHFAFPPISHYRCPTPRGRPCMDLEPWTATARMYPRNARSG